MTFPEGYAQPNRASCCPVESNLWGAQVLHVAVFMPHAELPHPAAPLPLCVLLVAAQVFLALLYHRSMPSQLQLLASTNNSCWTWQRVPCSIVSALMRRSSS